MDKKITKLAKKAGFIFWTKNEDWGPGPGHIDWSSNYDEEFEKFAKLLVKECAKVVDENETSSPFENFGDMIKHHFEVK